MSDSQTLTLESVVRRNDEIPWKTLDDRVVVLDLASGDFFELDEVGCRIWQALDGVQSLEQHAQRLVSEFGIDADTARSDVVAFVSELDGMGLVVRTA